MLEDYAGCRVLVVDDEPSNLELMRRVLLRRGLTDVVLHDDPRKALADLDAVDPDLVILDLHMPFVGGHEMLQRLRTWARGAYLPVVVLTADTTVEALQTALEHGATDFLTKPFNATEITLRVRNLLQTRELYRTLSAHLRVAETRLAGAQAGVDVLTELGAGEGERVRRRVADVIADGGPQMVFQPVVDLHDSTVVGHEALSRFGPGTGDPASWFRAADGVGLGPDLEVSAVKRAVDLRATARVTGFLAVNVSPGTLVAGHLDALATDGVDVVLELTEHEPVLDYVAVDDAFTPLREKGARLAIDDTGAGYAGLRHLAHLHPDIIKLDLSLVAGVTQDPVRRALTAALVRFAEDVGAQVIAEGVETRPQADVLADLGVRWVQGWLFGRPAPGF